MHYTITTSILLLTDTGLFFTAPPAQFGAIMLPQGILPHSPQHACEVLQGIPCGAEWLLCGVCTRAGLNSAILQQTVGEASYCSTSLARGFIDSNSFCFLFSQGSSFMTLAFSLVNSSVFSQFVDSAPTLHPDIELGATPWVKLRHGLCPQEAQPD